METFQAMTSPLLAPPVAPRARRWHRALPLLVFACGLPVASLAQVVDADEYLARLDSDQDGRIAVEEYQAWMGYAFERMDANGDGVLAGDELPVATDQTVSLAEHREALAEMFARQDTDADGFLNAAELAAPPQ